MPPLLKLPVAYFGDAFALGRLDTRMDHGEARFVIPGMVNGVLLTVVYTERGERIRIISGQKSGSA
jgi:uncharacterized DUF497 family protein